MALSLPSTFLLAAIGALLTATWLSRILPPPWPRGRDRRDVALGLAALAAMLFLALLAAGAIQLAGAGGDSDPTGGSIRIALAATIVANALAVAVLCIAGRVQGLGVPNVLGIERSPRARDFGLGLHGLLATLPAFLAIGMLTVELAERFGDDPQLQRFVAALRDDESLRTDPRVLVLAALVGPVLEEVLFRAGILRGLLAAIDERAAVVVSALLFALVHDGASQPPVFVIGLLLGLLYARTRSLWPCAIAHVAFNTVQLALVIPLDVGGPT
jgi:membrane protease YdiL (CAAX protease family)